MSDNAVFYPKPDAVERSYVPSMEEYHRLHKESLDNPAKFWGDIAQQFHWETPSNPEDFCSYNFDRSKGKIFVKWMEGATTNISYNLLDRNVKRGNGEKIAYYW